MTIKRIFTFVTFIPIVGLLAAFVFANRIFVRLTFNPFSPDKGAFTAPFFVWLFIFLAIGIMIGSVIMWFSQRKHRKTLYDREAEH
ncbi:MAG: hypothetical protein JSC188_001098 [Candidatus Tokpelaia sp. JSC188]|nr:MAG: hypothetical protein JSC188_001098 [Candidatus Tokpelaia sp. JSC188]